MLRPCVKKTADYLLAPFGFELRHRTSDPVLRLLDETRSTLRLHPGAPAHWAHSLSQLALSSHLRDLIASQKPDLVIDVGANHGQFAFLVRELGYTGPILSLEPQHRLARQLQARAAASDPLWTILHGAAGETCDELVLNIFADDTFSSFHSPNETARARFGFMLETTGRETVAVKPLGDWLAGSPYATAKHIFLKTDTQGHDLAVLSGASPLLSRFVIVLAEGSLVPLYDHVATPEALLAYLQPAGFRAAGAYAVSHSDTDLAALELDCLFTRTPR